MKKTHFDLAELAKDIKKFHGRIKKTDAKKDVLIDHLKYLTELYERGYIGYTMYPYLVTSLIQYEDEVPEFEELSEIVSLSSILELPNEVLEKQNVNRQQKEEKMIRIIKSV